MRGDAGSVGWTSPHPDRLTGPVGAVVRDLVGLPGGLRGFVVGLGLGGPAVAVALLACGVPGLLGLSRHEWLWAGVLLLIALVAELYPLPLTHRTQVSVATAAYVAMAVTLPVFLPGALALAASASGQVLRYRARRVPIDAVEVLFNVGQATAYVTAGAAAFWLAHGAWGGAARGPLALVPVAAAACAMHLVNTGLVALATGWQTDTSPWRVWRTTLSLDLPEHAALSVVGAAVALLAHDRPLLLAFMAAPLVLVRRAVAQSVQLRADTYEAIAALVEFVELRDPYTAGHSRRVATTSRLLARRLGLTEGEADAVEAAGRVHDVGKVAVDPAILIKQAKLTDAEWAEMKLHPVHGAVVIGRFSAYADGVPLVRHHHEAWDGSGYPDGLAGEAIPLGARILAVADTFDALTSDRPYRAGMRVEKAVGILQDGAGRQWDAAVVDALVGALRDAREAIPVYGLPHRRPAEAADDGAVPRGTQAPVDRRGRTEPAMAPR